ncbi:ribbon-helix-helix protein, CopG family [Georgenia yuyongxinii]|uniref:Ribbon-helix-helix protein, CopG family n=1 Tax=Georgenia yuyongxinii TaxID=2589797 RepID=A0A5B8C6E3_9MICO|nr:ribbon-helix-helix domain-containing protein [Georgenia yuyongxinii]QDC25690.1 ribbon-helix-helix protein, CopG family [Georgenia yuyongxinii]
MKLSISIPEDDVALIDEYARATGLSSRSAVIQRALSLLRMAALEQDYGAAWEEWEVSGHRHDWEATVVDGLRDAPR